MGKRGCAHATRTRSTTRITSASAPTPCGAVDPRSLPGRLRDLGSACCEQVFVAADRLQACTFLGEAAHDIAAGVVISSEAGCCVRHSGWRAARCGRDGPPDARRHPHVRRSAPPARGPSADGPAAAAPLSKSARHAACQRRSDLGILGREKL